MSEDQEPSIEEILSSIRQIIADDEEEEEVVAPDPEPEPEPEPEDEPEPEAEPEEEEEVLDLNDKIEDEPVEIDLEELDIEEIIEIEEEEEVEEAAPPPPPPPPIPDKLPDLDPDPEPAPIISKPTEEKAVEGFAKLASYVPIDRRNNSTLEDIIRDMLKPMLRYWLDENLPPLVERLVREELERIARQAMDD